MRRIRVLLARLLEAYAIGRIAYELWYDDDAAVENILRVYKSRYGSTARRALDLLGMEDNAYNVKTDFNPTTGLKITTFTEEIQ